MPGTAPLRIHKANSASSSDCSDMENDGLPQLVATRALADISVTAGRRNSNNYSKMDGPYDDDIPSSSPFPSPYSTPNKTGASPLNFWQDKLQENMTPSGLKPSTSQRRSSVERLKNRSQVSNNPFQNGSPSTPAAPSSARTKPAGSRLPIPTSSKNNTPLRGFHTGASNISSYGSNPEQKPAPPAKPFSILSPPRVDDSHIIISSPPRSSKQVTFTAAPQVQMFVPTTPEPSVSASENTYEDESETDSEDDEDYNMPVVGPEDWDADDHEIVTTQPHQPQQVQQVQQEQAPTDLPSPSGRPLPPLPPPTDSAESSPPRRLPLAERLEMVMRSSSPAFTQEKRLSGVSQAEVSLEYFSAEEEEEEEEETESEGDEEEGHESFSPVVLPEQPASDDEMSENDGLSRQLSFSSNKENIDVVRPEPPRTAEDVLNSEFRIPRISRESIRRQVQANRDQPEQAPAFASPEPRRQSAASVGVLTESAEQRPAATFTVTEREITMDLPTLAAKLNAEDEMEILPNILGRQASVRRSFIVNPEGTDEEYDSPLDHDDDESKYSTDSWSDHGEHEVMYEADEGEEDEESEPPTPTQATFAGALSTGTEAEDRLQAKEDLDLPELQSLSIADPAAVTESTNSSRTFVNEPPSAASMSAAQNFLHVPGSQRFSLDNSEGEFDDAMSVCESVIRHEIYDSDDYDEESMYDAESIRSRTPSPVPARRATIRSASGMRLMTRKSSAPADAATMAATRRIVSRAEEVPPVPPVPPVPKIDPAFLEPTETQPKEAEVVSQEEVVEDERPTSSGSQETISEEPVQNPEPVAEPAQKPEIRLSSVPEMKPEIKVDLLPEHKAETAQKSSQLSLPSLGLDLNMGSSLSVELDRVIEGQKRGYLMRENSKVIHASSREEANADAAKPAAGKKTQTQSWTVEPWQGSPGSTPRRRSGRGDSLKKKSMDPGRQHHAAAMAAKQPDLPTLEENENKDSVPTAPVEQQQVGPENSMAGDGAERGRLFVKVVAVKDLHLPLPPNESTYFCMTLDNGLHCVTTSWLELGKNAPIGQEFELIVLDDLEFQLTLQTKIAPPPAPVVVQEVPMTPQQSPPKPKSKFGNLFSSPKKRREQERLLHQQQLQRQQAAAAAAAQRQARPPSAWDLLHNLVAKDGSFARSYISAKDFEAKAYGRPYTVEVTCFNEWAVEMSSVKGKKNVPIRKPPYKIGKLEIQLLFVPRLPGMTDLDLPKSMNAAIREIKEAESVVNQVYEGYLSQQGGDCPYWRRRYFKLEGSRLTAYHESSRQLRANINLAKAVKVLDDRSTLTGSSGSKKRRKSGFAEDEEGYMFIEEGFRIRFANGECIDFYADSTKEKNGWMKVLYDTIGRCSAGRNWCDHVLKKEREEKAKAPPPVPVKPSMIPTTPRTPVPKTPSHSRSQSAVTTPNFQQLGMTPMSATPGRNRAPLPTRSGRPQSHHGGMR
ncbi:Bud site selection protein bud4 [Orbilia brochopaga]|uniref:Bud site selection protein bud4 n=1 Tax=Orbilia brochopaga TaxID=3140254 RepID=A0AAV9UGM3_9PEZI